MIDTPTHRKNISELTSDELDRVIVDIRNNRSRPIEIYEETRRVAQLAHDQKLRKQLGRQLEMFEKDLNTSNRTLERMVKRATQMRVLRLELELEGD